VQTIDIHAHFFPESWPDFAARFGSPDWPWTKPLGDGEAMIMLGNREFRRIPQVCWDPMRRLEDLERQGIDLQVISATPVLFSYHRPVEQALEVARIFNDAALEMCNHAGGHFRALCQVPLQDIDASCAEVSRSKQAGHIGVQIGNHVGPKNLDDPGIITFLHQRCLRSVAQDSTHLLRSRWRKLRLSARPNAECLGASTLVQGSGPVSTSAISRALPRRLGHLRSAIPKASCRCHGRGPRHAGL